MSKKCAREECGKTVYPIEELKCLDKVWHKQCFKCTVCGMTLSMKNYKGYDKRPYCEPHYPKTVASAVADTPEMRRIAENTKNQSNIKYHAEYEKMKGTKIEICDDPEMERLKKNTQVQSNIGYHGILEKKEKQEEIRPAEIPGEQQQAPQNGLNSVSSRNGVEQVAQQLANTNLIYSVEQGGAVSPQQNQQRSVGSIADYDPINGNWGTSGSAANQRKPNEKLGYLKTQVDNGPPKFCADFAAAQPPPSSLASSASPHSNLSSPQSTLSPTGKAGFAVKAIFDYTAADKDEVSFLEGDIIVNCEKIDDGWMTGTVQRTLQWGMLPANYVQVHKLPTGLHRLS
ncbi:unnamed protein product [Caenorhabditis angaria]|uniref:LIM and SH3 domain protein F42H10.3 n=1 Tax=Caenorhabditis angaria TaxID=860376 RepID=A0A9P1MYY0_9PELO|nr:unnamed protein product [Caenorhabditis angaria]